MSHAQRLTLIVTTVAALAPHAAQAQKNVASCKPVLDALAKQYSVPHHIYGTTTAGTPGAKPRPMEMIRTQDQNYILIEGKWKRSSMTPAMMAKQEQENVRDATAYACRRIRDESVGGVSAVVYSMHSESELSNSDGQVWIATGTGLVVRMESDTDTGEVDNTHLALRYEYTNVQAPAGATGP
jgi:hypothetical protein